VKARMIGINGVHFMPKIARNRARSAFRMLGTRFFNPVLCQIDRENQDILNRGLRSGNRRRAAARPQLSSRLPVSVAYPEKEVLAPELDPATCP
jgi:hypothetical protein